MRKAPAWRARTCWAPTASWWPSCSSSTCCTTSSTEGLRSGLGRSCHTGWRQDVCQEQGHQTVGWLQ